MNSLGGNNSNQPEDHPAKDAITTGLWAAASAAVANLVIFHETWDPGTDTRTNITRGVMAAGLAGMAVRDWRSFQRGISS